jgi:membrane associated rhomboid family serine protease
MMFDTRYTQSRVPSLTRAVRTIILINLVLYIVQYFAPEGYLKIFGLVPAYVLGRAWIWQLGTYMFLHGGLFHIFFNMLFLWMMGSYFFIRIKAKHFAVLVGLLELISLFALPNAGIARFAHLGGIVVGYFYLRWERYSYPLKCWWRKSKLRVEDSAQRREEEKARETKAVVDRILDKIGKHGLDSLTDRERDFLKKQSGKRS